MYNWKNIIMKNKKVYNNICIIQKIRNHIVESLGASGKTEFISSAAALTSLQHP